MSLPTAPSPVVSVALSLMLGAGLFLFFQDYVRGTEVSARNAQPYFAEISTTTSVGVVTPLTPGDVRVPILVYHIVRPAYTSDSTAVRAIAHTPEVFDAQMRHLRNAGYHVISFTDLERRLLNNASLPSKPIIISFDDGWSDQFVYALPILQKYGYQATFFVFTNSIGRRGFFTLDNLKTLRDAGMTIGSHSRTHPYLTKVASPTALESEIIDSKRILEKELGVTINQFAYPFGQYTDAILALVKEAGYTSARGDFYSGAQSRGRLFELSAMNTPTTTAQFARRFP